MGQSNNAAANDEEFKSRLVELLKEFGNSPNALAEYLINQNAFRASFVTRVHESGNLGQDKSARPAYFTDLEALLEHQDNMMNPEAAPDAPVVPETAEERETRLYAQTLDSLCAALAREDYDQAARVRDYMLLMKMEIPQNIF